MLGILKSLSKISERLGAQKHAECQQTKCQLSFIRVYIYTQINEALNFDCEQ